MRCNFIIRERLPFRKEKRGLLQPFMKESEIFEQTLGLPEVRDDD